MISLNYERWASQGPSQLKENNCCFQQDWKRKTCFVLDAGQDHLANEKSAALKSPNTSDVTNLFNRGECCAECCSKLTSERTSNKRRLPQVQMVKLFCFTTIQDTLYICHFPIFLPLCWSYRIFLFAWFHECVTWLWNNSLHMKSITHISQYFKCVWMHVVIISDQ